MLLKELLDTTGGKYLGKPQAEPQLNAEALTAPLPKDTAKLPTMEDVENDSDWLEFVET